MFNLVRSNQDGNAKRYKSRRYYLPIGIIKNYNVIINGKTFYDRANDSDVKRYKEIRKLTVGQSQDYTTGCLLDYECIKNHYNLVAIDWIRQQEFDADPKAIQQVGFVRQLKDIDDINAGGTQNMFILTVLEKTKETKLNSFQESVTVV